MRIDGDREYFAESDYHEAHAFLLFAAVIGGLAVALLTAGATRAALVIGVFTVALVLMGGSSISQRTLEHRIGSGTVRMRHTRLCRPTRSAESPIASVRTVLAPVRVRYTGRPELRWKGWVVVAEVGDQELALCCVKREHEAEEYLLGLPEWLTANVEWREEEREYAGNRRLW